MNHVPQAKTLAAHVFNALVLIQPAEVEGGALSDDDDFQDESMFTHREPAAASERVHRDKAKVCVATGVCGNTDK